MSRALFDANVHTDFQGFELNAGHAGAPAGSGPDSVNPSNSYGSVDDRYRVNPDANGNRIYIDSLVASGRGYPNNRAIKMTLRSGDGTFLSGSGGGDVVRVQWRNAPDAVYDTTQTLLHGQARPADFLPAAASGGVGFGNPTFALNGEEQWWAYSLDLDAAFPTFFSDRCIVGLEWHHNSGGVAPTVMALDLLYNQPRIIIRGGDSGAYNTDGSYTVGNFLNRQVYFDDSGFIDILDGPLGGGGGTFKSLVTGSVIPAPTHGPPVGTAYPPDMRYVDRGVFNKAKRYDFVFHVRWSDRDAFTNSFPAGTGGPLCSQVGFLEAWFHREDWGTGVWKVLLPKQNIATCYSINDKRGPTRKSAGLYGFFGMYTAFNQGLAPAIFHLGQVKMAKAGVGVTGANVSFDGTDPAAATPNPPVSTAAPVISGTAKTGFQVSGTDGTFTGTGITYTYEWQLDDGSSNFTAVTANGTGNKYILPAAAINRRVRLKVTATNATGTASAISNVLGPVTLGELDPGVRANEATLSQNGNWAGPIQTGIGQLALTSNHIVSPASGSHQSRRTDISSADVGVQVAIAQAPSVATGDAGALWARIQNPNSGTMAAYLFAYNEGIGYRIFKCTGGSSFAQLGSTVASPAVVAGWLLKLTCVGTTLTGYYSTDNGVTWTQVIQITGESSITGAGSIGLELAGTTILANDFDQASIAAVPANTTAPVITGSLPVGSILSVTNGAWTNAPTGFTYQWRRDNGGGGTYSDIAGATAKTYQTVQADVDCQIRCIVTAANGNGSTPFTAAAVGPVTQIAPVNTTTPLASGVAVIAGLVACTTGTWDPAYTSLTYQWQRRAPGSPTVSDITGATGNTYVPVVGDDGYILSCRVTATNAGGSTSQSSNELAPVTAPTRLQRYFWDGVAWR